MNYECRTAVEKMIIVLKQCTVIYKSFKVYCVRSKNSENKTKKKPGNLLSVVRSSKYIDNSFKTVYSHFQTCLSVQSLNYNTNQKKKGKEKTGKTMKFRTVAEFF